MEPVICPSDAWHCGNVEKGRCSKSFEASGSERRTGRGKILVEKAWKSMASPDKASSTYGGGGG